MRIPLLAAIVACLALPILTFADSEDSDLSHLPVWTGDYTIVDTDPDVEKCGAGVKDATPDAFAAFVDRPYEIRALGPIRVASESFGRTLSHTYDKDSGTSTPVKVEEVTRSRTLVQRYEITAEDGTVSKSDVSCSLACTGGTCASSGCSPNGLNCTPHSCLSLVTGQHCTGTCTKSSGGTPNQDNKH